MPRPSSSSLAERAEGLFHLVDGQAAARPDHFDPAMQPRLGMNFAMLDYLGLAAHPAVRSAALAALGQHRLAAPGPAPRLGLTAPALALEARIAAFLRLPAAATFASGSDAIRQTLRAMLRPEDDVIVDSDAHPAMFDTVLLSRARLHRSPAASVEGVERRLSRLARQPGHGRLVIMVPAISAHGSRIAELAELAALARLHDALLIADVSHDLGAMGQSGGGVMEIQACLGRVDVVLGSFAKCFGGAGGFAAYRDPALKPALRQGHWQTTALSPVNASAILASFDIITAPEGRRRRRNLHGVALRLRNHLMADGIKVMGKASPLVPVLLPAPTALARTALLESAGPLVTLLQAPSVAGHAPRWRLQLTADHSPADIDDLAELIRDVTRAFDRRPTPRPADRP
ncbi:pyridoxal phosphate-dependent aminotransferase family protein [Tabrizicola sp.]|uniref:aminotransferase class I/II-fold pyridoxal phosphate-dependent enzyme n=1 Tax=Tabrizicola sp. TaxID=2005166 RepID=UPI001A4B4893|nr:pyridoxal phosphate-dependent aminotransferase family protein [Tabrizicola sp.]MBL9060981.1 pyridoxal phosphate-dependent aminotransferase family protein [Tabrizicola sp.]